uniref:Late blight resistance protein Rpi-blb2 n=1 Tax=Solanum tuberosum TaxID=4113 RepID=M1B026_SOLTU
MKSPLVGNALPSKSGICYDHLSDHVKPCLVCLASYPKDEDIWMSELKDLLIVQGLVEQIEMKSAEEVVDELILIPFDNSICKIHDLVHDFCYIKSRKEIGITLTDSLLNEIGMLVHLKYLIIQTKAKALPPSFSNLWWRDHAWYYRLV